MEFSIVDFGFSIKKLVLPQATDYRDERVKDH